MNSSLWKHNTPPCNIIVKDVPIPDFKPQLLTQFHRAKVIGGIPYRVIVIHHRVSLFIYAIVEDLHIGICFCEGVCPQACSSVNLQLESSSTSP